MEDILKKKKQWRTFLKKNRYTLKGGREVDRERKIEGKRDGERNIEREIGNEKNGPHTQR